MPIHEYMCPGCKLRFELLCRFGEAVDEASCPRCRNKASRVFSSFSSFSRDSAGQSAPIAGNTSCGGCSATSCDTCRS
jgi:putative FmdB family regulatory protein